MGIEKTVYAGMAGMYLQGGANKQGLTLPGWVWRGVGVLCVLLLLLPPCTYAQPVTGVWRGKMIRGSGLRQKAQNIEVKLVANGDSIVGTTYYYLGQNFVRYALKGYIAPEYGTVHWQDVTLIDMVPERRATAKGYEEALKAEADLNCPDGKTMLLTGSATLPGEPPLRLELRKVDFTNFGDEWDSIIEGYHAGMAQRSLIDSVWQIASVPYEVKKTAAAAMVAAAPAPEALNHTPRVATQNTPPAAPVAKAILPPTPTPLPPTTDANPPAETTATTGTRPVDTVAFSTPLGTVHTAGTRPAVSPSNADNRAGTRPAPTVASSTPPDITATVHRGTPVRTAAPSTPSAMVNTAGTRPVDTPPNADTAGTMPVVTPPNADTTGTRPAVSPSIADNRAGTRPAVSPSIADNRAGTRPAPTAAAATISSSVAQNNPPAVDTVVAVPPTPPAMAQAFATRRKMVQTSIPITGDSIELRFYDNAEVDGDSISLFLNGQLLFQHVRLESRAYVFKISTTDLPAVSELTMVAENLGAIPPNTAYMEAFVHGQRYTARLESSEITSAVIELRRE